MERMTYVDEDGIVLFNHKDYPKDEGVSITTLAEDEQYEFLEEIAERLANRERLCELRKNDGEVSYMVDDFCECGMVIDDGWTYCPKCGKVLMA